MYTSLNYALNYMKYVLLRKLLHKSTITLVYIYAPTNRSHSFYQNLIYAFRAFKFVLLYNSATFLYTKVSRSIFDWYPRAKQVEKSRGLHFVKFTPHVNVSQTLIFSPYRRVFWDLTYHLRYIRAHFAVFFFSLSVSLPIRNCVSIVVGATLFFL